MKLLTLMEAANTLKASEIEVKQYVKEGIPHLHIGHDYRFLEEEIIAWKEKHFPSQEQLEKDFVDEKNRTLKDYVLIDQVVEFLQIKKEKVYRLCKNGMPFQTVGKKRFYHLEDIVNFFRKGTVVAEKTEVKKVIPIFVVESSYSMLQSSGRTGIVEKTDDQVIEHSFKFYSKTVLFSKFMAMYHAMTIAKKKGYEQFMIATNHSETVHNPESIVELPKKVWVTKTNALKEVQRLVSLYEEMKNSVQFMDARDSSVREMYEKAHLLSKKLTISTDQKLSVVAVPVDRFKAKNEINLKPQSVASKDTPIFVVDGSCFYHTGYCGAGVVQKIGRETIGHSFVFQGDSSDIAELMAIYQALDLIKKNDYKKAVVVTDQTRFVNRHKRNVLSNSSKNPYLTEIQDSKFTAMLFDLYAEMKDRIQFVYRKNLKKEAGMEMGQMYENAHHLSRIYYNNAIKGISLFDTNLHDVLGDMVNVSGKCVPAKVALNNIPYIRYYLAQIDRKTAQSDIKQVIQPIQPSITPLYVVNGSHKVNKNICGVGVVEKIDHQTTGFSYVFNGVTSTVSEYMAIYYAMKRVKEKGFKKAIIATDFELFAKNPAHVKELLQKKWVKETNAEKELTLLRTLYQEMKDCIQFIYYKDLPKVTNTEIGLLYSNANALSKYYKEYTISDISLLKDSVNNHKNKLMVSKEAASFVHDTREIYQKITLPQKNIEISFDSSDEIFTYLNVVVDGKKKRTKINSRNSFSAVLKLANDYMEDKKIYFNFTIKKLPSFEKDIQALLNAKTKHVEMFYKSINALEKKSNFKTEDNYLPYIENCKKVLNIA